MRETDVHDGGDGRAPRVPATRHRAHAPRFGATLLALLAPAMAAGGGTARASVATRGDAERKAALAAKPDARRGATLYSTCAACHGPDGGGVQDGSIPAIAGQWQRVLVKQVADFRRSERLDIRMEHFADRKHLEGAQDIADVTAYAASLARATPTGIGDGKSLSRGGRLWVLRCSGCHGATGKGDAATEVPRLAGQHAGYLERQLLDAADGRRPNMNASHRQILKGLDPVDAAGIADYLSRMK